MSADDLSDRFGKAHRNLASLQQKVQKAAVNAHQDVAHLLRLALKSLHEVVEEVHAHYTEDGELDENGKQILSKMKESFATVETAAKTCSNGLGKLHEEVGTYGHVTSHKVLPTSLICRSRPFKAQQYHVWAKISNLRYPMQRERSRIQIVSEKTCSARLMTAKKNFGEVKKSSKSMKG